MNVKKIKNIIENSVVLFDFAANTVTKQTVIVANGSFHECPVSNKVDQMIIDNHVKNGGKMTTDLVLVSNKKVVGKNGMDVFLVKIDGVVYEMYADFCCILH